MNAWLITWEGTDRSISDEAKLVAIFRADYKTEFVRRLIRIHYQASISNAGDLTRVAYRPKLWPRVQNWGGRLWCGYSERGLYARTVRELEVVNDAKQGCEVVSWREPDEVRQRPPRYRLEVTRGQRRTLSRRSSVMIADAWPR